MFVHNPADLFGGLTCSFLRELRDMISGNLYGHISPTQALWLLSAEVLKDDSRIFGSDRPGVER